MNKNILTTAEKENKNYTFCSNNKEIHDNLIIDGSLDIQNVLSSKAKILASLDFLLVTGSLEEGLFNFLQATPNSKIALNYSMRSFKPSTKVVEAHFKNCLYLKYANLDGNPSKGLWLAFRSLNYNQDDILEPLTEEQMKAVFDHMILPYVMKSR